MSAEELLTTLERIRYEMLLSNSEVFKKDTNTKPRNSSEIMDLYNDFINNLKNRVRTDDSDICETDPESNIGCIQMLPDGCHFIQLMNGEDIPLNTLTTYHCDSDGKSWLVGVRSCLFCDYCTDVYLDWNGPYGFICSIGKDVCCGCIGECEFFECDEYETAGIV